MIGVSWKKEAKGGQKSKIAVNVVVKKCKKTRDIRCRKNETFHRPNEDTRPDNCLPREGSQPASARFNKASDQVSLYVEGEAKTSRPWPQFAVQSLSEIKATGRIHKNSSSPYTFCKVHLSASSTLLLQPGGDVYVERPTMDRLTEPPPNDHKISYKIPPLYAKLQSRRPDDYYLHSALKKELSDFCKSMKSLWITSRSTIPIYFPIQSLSRPPRSLWVQKRVLRRGSIGLLQRMVRPSIL